MSLNTDELNLTIQRLMNLKIKNILKDEVANENISDNVSD